MSDALNKLSPVWVMQYPNGMTLVHQFEEHGNANMVPVFLSEKQAMIYRDRLAPEKRSGLEPICVGLGDLLDVIEGCEGIDGPILVKP